MCLHFVVTVAEVHTPAASFSSADQVNAATDTPQTDVTDMTPVQVLVNSVTVIICGFVIMITVTDFELYVTASESIARQTMLL